EQRHIDDAKRRMEQPCAASSRICPVALATSEAFGFPVRAYRNCFVLETSFSKEFPYWEGKKMVKFIDTFDSRKYDEVKPMAFYIPGEHVEAIEKFKKRMYGT